MLLYIHVPFCRKKCHYCGFFSIPIGQNQDDIAFYEPFLAWRRYILAEARFYAQFLPASLGLGSSTLDSNKKESSQTPQVVQNPQVSQILQALQTSQATQTSKQIQTSQKVRIDSIFFGGGTPSLIPPKEIGKIIRELAKIFEFSPSIEVSMEANPESMLKENARAYLQAGINRVSLGAQSLNDKDLACLGRAHTHDDFLKAFYVLDDAGFHNINVDLMWGLPNQRRNEWFKQLKLIASMQPKHLSCYGLSIDEGSAFYEMEEGLNLPSEKDLASMYMDGAAILEEAGYLQYEISNFSKMGYQCRHNVGYWEGQSYLGLGPSATSTLSMPLENWKNMGLDLSELTKLSKLSKSSEVTKLANLPLAELATTLTPVQTNAPLITIRWKNPANIEAWVDCVKKETPCPEKEILSKKEKAQELLMLRLRMVRGLRVKDYENLTGRNFFGDHKKLVKTLHTHGLLRIQEGYVRLSQNGLLVSNTILAHFFESLDNSMD